MATEKSNHSPSRMKIAAVARRNFWLLTANGAIAAMTNVVYSPALVFPVLVYKLTGSNFWVGLPMALATLGWLLPQTFAAHKNRHRTHQKWAYFWPAVVRMLAWVISASALTFFFNAPPAILFWVIMVMFAISSFSSGMLGPAFFEVSTKVIPPEKRGKLFGNRQMLGNIAGAALSFFVVARLLDKSWDELFPINYGILFWGAVLGTLLIPALFMLLKENRHIPRPTAGTFGEHVKQGFALFKEDKTFSRYMIVRIMLMLSLTATCRYTVYVGNVLNIPGRFIGIFIGVQTIALGAMSLVWGRISDRKGRKVLLVFSAIAAVVAPVLVLGAGSATKSVLFTIASIEFTGQVAVLCVLFAIIGSLNASLQIGVITMLMDMAPPHKRASYFGFTNTFLAPLCLSFMAAGWVINGVGYTWYFLICTGLGVIALSLALTMKEIKGRQYASGQA